MVDLSESGLAMFFKPYMIEALELIWRSNIPLNSRMVWKQINESLLISRASVINFLNAAVELGILNYVEITGKGGYHRIYSAKLDKPQTIVYLKDKVKERVQTL